jgi:hypothetical protein
MNRGGALDFKSVSFGPTLSGGVTLSREGLGAVAGGGLQLVVFDATSPLWTVTLETVAEPRADFVSLATWVSGGALPVGPVTFGGGSALRYDVGGRAATFTGVTIGPEVIVHHRFAVGRWQPVLQTYVRGELTLLGRDKAPDRLLLGLRFLFDIPL